MDSGKCVICDQPASQACAHCGTISYCGKEHQKEHWPSHKNVCKPYKIERTDEMGRYMVASRDIKPGELIIKESPVVIGPRIDSVPLCLGCYKTATTVDSKPRLCSKCNVAPICCPECEAKPSHSESECDSYLRFSDKDPSKILSLTDNLQIVMPLRCLLLRPETEEKSKEDEKWESLMKLESHVKESQESAIWRHHKEKVVDLLDSVGMLKSEDDHSLVQKICGILDVNSFELRGPNPAVMTHAARQGERLRGVYLEAALMSHDCIGNTHLSVDDDYVMTIHASVPIKAGDPILFNYASTLESTSERLHRLREGKYFSCKCKRCTDPTELGTYMSSIICSRCHEGFVVPTDPLQKESVADGWICEKCKHKYHSRLIKQTVSQAWSEIEDADNTDSRIMENLLKRFARTFPQSNVIMVEIKQNLVALYRDIILREPSPSRKVMQRKINLCLDLLTVLDAIEPGISRLRGITMYELHTPKVMLANREYDSGEITSEELLNRLMECENLLKDAISMLLYEPSNSPEGKLLRVAIDELRVLRENIQDVKMLNEDENTEEGRKGNKRKNSKRTKK